jgi:hypothetical protein
MESPGTVPDELDQEGVTARPFGHHGKRLVTDCAPKQLNRLLNGSFYVFVVHPSEMVAISSAKEGEHLIVYDIAHRRGEVTYLADAQAHLDQARGSVSSLATRSRSVRSRSRSTPGALRKIANATSARTKRGLCGGINSPTGTTFAPSALRPQRGEGDHLADVRHVAQQHQQAVDPQAEPRSWRQPVLERP